MEPPLFKISSRLLLACATLAFLFALLAFSPTLYGLTHPPEGFVFLGFAGTDEYQHLTWIKQALEGKWLFKSPYFLGSRPALFFQPFYLLVGGLVQISGLSAPLVFSLTRLPLSFLFFFSVFATVAYFLKENRLRIAAFILASLGGGLAWLDWSNPNPDQIKTLFYRSYFLVEANNFLIGKQDQATMLTGTLLIWSFLFFLKGLTSAKRGWLAAAGLTAFLLFLIHPFMAITVYSILFIFFLALNWQSSRIPFQFSRRSLSPFFIFTAVSFPPVAYYLFLVRHDPTFSVWAYHKSTPNKPLLTEIPLLFGFFLLPLFPGIRSALARPSAPRLFLVVWFGGSLLASLLYPYNFAARLMAGVHLPLAILAAIGLEQLIKRYRLRPLLTWFIFIILTLPSVVYWLWRDAQLINHRLPDNYASRETIEAVNWLDRRTDFEDTTLASYYDHYLISALAGNQVFGGAQGYCPPKNDLKPGQRPYCRIVALRKTMNRDEERAFLDVLGIRYFFIDKQPLPPGRKIGLVPDVYSYEEAEARDYLTPVWENHAVVIYKINLKKL
jgi:hypothetical protein